VSLCVFCSAPHHFHPKTKISGDYIFNALEVADDFNIKSAAKIVWLGGKPSVEYFTKSKKGNSWDMMSLTFHDKRKFYYSNKQDRRRMVAMLAKIAVVNTKVLTFQEIKADFESNLEDFELFWHSKSH
jgi:hypothetical protein